MSDMFYDTLVIGDSLTHVADLMIRYWLVHMSNTERTMEIPRSLSLMVFGHSAQQGRRRGACEARLRAQNVHILST